jgi:hypothetical protein
MKPKKPAPRAPRPAEAPEAPPTSSSRPEKENDDTEAMPPDAGAAEADEERAEERDDGMPGEDLVEPAPGRHRP